MIVINVRSPYIITLSGEIEGAKINIKLWKPNGTEPTNPTYVLSKSIPSETQKEVTFNISQFAKDFIENKLEDVTEIGLTDYNHCYIKVERYYLIDGEYVYNGEDEYLCTNGYTFFTDGVNYSNLSEFKSLSTLKEIQYNREKKGDYYVQMYFPNNDYKVVYYADSRRVEYPVTEGINNIPLTIDNYFFEEENYIKVVDANAVGDCCVGETYEIKAVPVCEPILTPSIVSFVNRHGAIQQITFFKMKTENVETTSDKYNLMPSNWDYDVTQGSYKRFNFNGNKSVRMNTGFVPESYGEAIQDLLLSENIWIDKVPALIKTQSLELKTQIRNKNINYELEFEYGFNLINDVI